MRINCFCSNNLVFLQKKKCCIYIYFQKNCCFYLKLHFSFVSHFTLCWNGRQKLLQMFSWILKRNSLFFTQFAKKWNFQQKKLIIGCVKHVIKIIFFFLIVLQQNYLVKVLVLGGFALVSFGLWHFKLKTFFVAVLMFSCTNHFFHIKSRTINKNVIAKHLFWNIYLIIKVQWQQEKNVPSNKSIMYVGKQGNDRFS